MLPWISQHKYHNNTTRSTALNWPTSLHWQGIYSSKIVFDKEDVRWHKKPPWVPEKKHPFNFYIWEFHTSKYLLCYKSTIKNVTTIEMLTRKIINKQYRFFHTINHISIGPAPRDAISDFHQGWPWPHPFFRVKN